MYIYIQTHFYFFTTPCQVSFFFFENFKETFSIARTQMKRSDKKAG